MVATPNTPLPGTSDLSNTPREQPIIESNAEHCLPPVITQAVERASDVSRRFSSPILHVFVGKSQQIFSAHKAILEQSPVLAASINPIDDTVSVDLQSVEPSTFGLLLEFLYTNILVVDTANPYDEVTHHLCSIYSTAELLALHILRKLVLAKLGQLGNNTLTGNELGMFLDATLPVYKSGHADDDFRHMFRGVIFAYMTGQTNNNGVFRKAGVLQWPTPADIIVPAMQALDFVKSFIQNPTVPLEMFCDGPANLGTGLTVWTPSTQTEERKDGKGKGKGVLKDEGNEADFSDFYKEIEVKWRNAHTLRGEALATKREPEASCASLQAAEKKLKSMAFENEQMKEVAETKESELKEAQVNLHTVEEQCKSLALKVKSITESTERRDQQLEVANSKCRSLTLQIQPEVAKAAKATKRKLKKTKARLRAVQQPGDSATAALKTERRKNG